MLSRWGAARNTSSHQCTVECTRLASALRVSERGDTRVEPKAFSENVFDVIGTNGLEIGIVSAFGDDDDGFTFPDLTVLGKGET